VGKRRNFSLNLDAGTKLLVEFLLRHLDENVVVDLVFAL